MIRVVVDPGVFVSAIITRKGTAPDLLVRAILHRRLEAVASPLLIDEFERVIHRPKFDLYADPRSRRTLFAEIVKRLAPAPDPHEIRQLLRDPKDDYLVAIARQESVDAIVSGDGHLREARLTDPPVWSPRECVERLASS